MRALLPVMLAGWAAAAPPPWENPRAVARALFLDNCAVCHETVKPKSPKIGPSLARFKHVPPERVEAFRKYIVTKVRGGGIVMPAFADVLTDAQMKAIAGYLLQEGTDPKSAADERR